MIRLASVWPARRARAHDRSLMKPDEQIRQQLAREYCAIIDGWTTTEVCARTGVYPARVSGLRAGRLAGYSIARLIRMIAAHGFDVEIVIRPTPRPVVAIQRPSGTVTRAAISSI